MKKTLLVFVILLLCGLCAYGGYWYASKKLSEVSAVSTETSENPNKIDSTNSNSKEPNMDDYLTFSDSGDLLSKDDLKKWIGKYETTFVEDAGERPYNVVMQIEIDASGDTHLVINYQDRETNKIDEGYQVFGHCTKSNTDNTKIEFLPEVISQGADTGRDTGFYLLEKNGKFSILNQMANPMNTSETTPISIKKN